MEDFELFLNQIEDSVKRDRLASILNYVKKEFPQLKEEIKWKQPMFTDHGTFIIGFSIAKEHISVSPESEVLDLFQNNIDRAGYSRSKELFRIKWTDTIDFDLLNKMVAYNIKSKKNMTKFWR